MRRLTDAERRARELRAAEALKLWTEVEKTNGLRTWERVVDGLRFRASARGRGFGYRLDVTNEHGACIGSPRNFAGANRVIEMRMFNRKAEQEYRAQEERRREERAVENAERAVMSREAIRNLGGPAKAQRALQLAQEIEAEAKREHDLAYTRYMVAQQTRVALELFIKNANGEAL